MAHLYKSLVEPNHHNCIEIEKAIQACLRKARNIFGDSVMNRLSEVMIEYYDKGRCAAMAVVGRHRETGKKVGLIQFSMRLVRTRITAMVRQIVPHELAHVICMANGWDMGHGKVWRQVCMMLGGDGETFNTLDTIDGRLKKLYEAKGDDGHSYWLNAKQRRSAASMGIMVRNSAGLEFTLTKQSLTGNIKTL